MPEATLTETRFQVYTLPGCVQCKLTTQKLDRDGLEYELVDMANPEHLAYAKSLGYQSAPVVLYGDEHWSGFRPDLIQQIAASQQ